MIAAAYNYMQVHYPQRPATKASTHKRSELRHIYNRIIDINKQSPLYLIRMSPEKQSFAIQIKESATALNEIVRSITQDEDISMLKKKAHSSNEEAVSAVIATKNQAALPEAFTIKVNQLALRQSNQGTSLPADANGLKEGEYHFSIAMNQDSYDFIFHIEPRTDNHTALNKLAAYINDSHIGVTASIEQDGKKNTVRMSLASDETGSSTGKVFSLKDTGSPGKRGLVAYYGINQIVSRPQNAYFELNGEEKESSRNSILLEKKIRLSLHQTTEEPVTIDYTTDADFMTSKLTTVVNSYNSIAELANLHRGNSLNSKSLPQELSAFIGGFRNELEACGVNIEENGSLSIDSYLAYQAAEDGEIARLLTDSDGICKALLDKTASLSIDPMNYIDKIMVSYPNFTRIALRSPYITSMYSGMLFNAYC